LLQYNQIHSVSNWFSCSQEKATDLCDTFNLPTGLRPNLFLTRATPCCG